MPAVRDFREVSQCYYPHRRYRSCAGRKRRNAPTQAPSGSLAAIRAAVGPQIVLRADANQGYTPKERSGCAAFASAAASWDLAGMAQVWAAVDVLIEAVESAYSPHDVMQVIRAQAADAITIKIAKATLIQLGDYRDS